MATWRARPQPACIMQKTMRDHSKGYAATFEPLCPACTLVQTQKFKNSRFLLNSHTIQFRNSHLSRSA